MALSFIKKYAWYVAGLLLICTLWYLPYIVNARYGLLDDMWHFREAQQTNIFDWHSLFARVNGRAIPFTIYFYSVLFKLTHYSALGMVVCRLLELMVLVVGIFYFLSKRSLANALWACALFITSSSLVTNFYELFTQDHLSLLILLIFSAVYFGIKKRVGSSNVLPYCRVVLSLVLLSLFFLTKETNIFIIGVFIALVVFDLAVTRNRRLVWLNLLYTVFSMLWLAFYFLAVKQSSGGAYNLAFLPRTLVGYAVILNCNLLLVVYLAHDVYKKVKVQTLTLSEPTLHTWAYLFFVTIFGLGVYLPWGAVADRYLMVAVAFFYLLFFSIVTVSLKNKFLLILLSVVLASNIFFAAFHMVRFYGGRMGDANLMTYLVNHSSQYDQVCLQGSPSSSEDLLEMKIWLNDVNHLNKQLCTLTDYTNDTTGQTSFFEKEGIVYGKQFVNSARTIVALKQTSGAPVIPIDARYTFSPHEKLEYTIHNMHPTRGWEVKEFSWYIGIVSTTSKK